MKVSPDGLFCVCVESGKKIQVLDVLKESTQTHEPNYETDNYVVAVSKNALAVSYNDIVEVWDQKMEQIMVCEFDD